jgi:ubiquinone/menaquinone biosynthesis C-methylase UbiE
MKHDHTADQQRWAQPHSRTAANWIAEDERMDQMGAPFGNRAITRAALQPGEAVIDIGCGTGRTALTAWQAVAPAGSVLGIDVSLDMLDQARLLCAGATGISFVHADAQSHLFASAAADVIISRFGLAHFSDTPAAFANIRHALRPCGRLAFTEWGPEADNAWMTLIGGVARRVLPAALLHQHGSHEHADHSHAPEFGDTDALRRALTRAGWAEVQVDLVKDRAWLGSSADDVVEWVFRSELPSGFGLLDRVLLRRFRTALTSELTRYTDADGVRLPAAVWLVSAVSPQLAFESNADRS